MLLRQNWEDTLKNTSVFLLTYADVPEWSNGLGSGPSSLVLTQVRVLPSAVFSIIFLEIVVLLSLGLCLHA